MDDSVAALLCLPFLIFPALVLAGIIASKLMAFERVRKIRGATEFAPGPSMDDPRNVSDKDFIAETMQLLKTQPTPPEVIVEQVKCLRFAEATGSFDKALQMLSQMRFARETPAKS
jgi:hypothetical protein